MKFVPIPVVCLYFVTAGQVKAAENAEHGVGSVSKRFEERCAKFAESVFQVVPDPVLLPGAKPKRRDTCAINSQPTIVGGELASPREFPHMALIGFGDYPIKWRCGGSLINEQWVISVAHCTVTPDNLVAKYVLLGDLNVLSEEDERNHQSSPKIYRIIAHKHHPNYRRPSCYNDISLYKLNETVAFNEFVRPICLHAETSSENQTVLASGWGDTSHKGKQSEKLRKVGLNIVNHTDCSKAYPLTERDVRRQMKVGVNGTVQVCAWAQGKDTCQGDSGGPLQQALKTPYCMYTLIGLTSVGFKCATGAPGVYTRVNHYLPWIEKIAFTEKN